MTEQIANLGFAMDTSGIKRGIDALNDFAKTGEKTESKLTKSFENAKDRVVDFTNKMKESGRTIKDGGQIVNNQGKVLDGLTNSFKKLTDAANKAGNDLGKYKSSVLSVNVDIERSNTLLKIQSKSLADSAIAADKETNALENMTSEYRSANSALEKFLAQQVRAGRTVDEAGNVFTRNGVKAKGLSSEYKKLQSTLVSAANNQDRIATAMQTALSVTDKNKAAIAEFNAKQKELTERSKLVTNTLKKQSAASDTLNKKMSNYVPQAKSSAKATGDLGKKLGMAGVQFEQFFGQVGSGTPFLRALGYQATDLGIVLGAPLLGAVVGISSALGAMLLPTLFKSTSAMGELEKAIEAVNKVASNKDGIVQLTDEIARLSKKSIESTKVLIEGAAINSRKASEAALKGITEAFDSKLGISEFLTDFEDLLSLQENGAKFTNSYARLTRKLGESFGATGEDAKKLGLDILDSINNARDVLSSDKGNFADVSDVKTLEDLQTKISKLADSVSGKKREKVISFAAGLQEMFEKGISAAEISDKLKKSLKDLETTIEPLTKKGQDQSEAIAKLNDSLLSQIDILSGVEGAQKKAYESSVLQQLNIKEMPEDIQKLIDKIFELKAAKESEAEANRIQDYINSLTQQKIALTDGAKAAQDYALALRFPDGVNDQIKSLNDEIYQLNFDKQTESILNMGDAWNQTGNAMVDAFGNAAQMIERYNSKMKDLAKQQDIVNQERLSGVDVTERQDAINSAMFRTEIQGYSDAASAATSFFGEKTAARKAFHGIEVALNAVEIAMSLKTTALNVAAGAAKFFAQSGWGGFAGVAGMIGVMAGLGYSSSGGGSYKAPSNDFSGTVLGSNDGSKSIETTLDIESEQLSELVKLNQNFRLLPSLISGLSSTVVSNSGIDTSQFDIGTDYSKVGSLIGGVSLAGIDEISKFVFNTKKSISAAGIEVLQQSLSDIIDSMNIEAVSFADINSKKKILGITTSDKTSRQTDDISDNLSIQLSKIFGSISSSFEESAKLLGIDLNGYLDRYVIGGFELNTKGLTGEEIQTKLTEALSMEADKLAAPFVDSIKEYQKVGEGSYETFVRLGIEQSRFNEALRLTGNTLNDVFNVDTAQNIIELAGGIDALSESSANFADNFLSDSQQIKLEGDRLNDILSSLGIDQFTATRQGFADLVQSIDLTSESGQSLYVELLGLSSSIDDLITKTERLNSERTSLTIDLLEAQGKTEEALALKRSEELSALDETLQALQLQVWAEQDRQEAISNTTDEINSSTSSLQSLVDSIKGVLGVGAVTLDQALNDARQGNFDTASKLNISNARTLNASNFTSSQSLAIAQAKADGKLLELSRLAENQITENEQQLNVLTDINTGIQQLVDFAKIQPSMSEAVVVQSVSGDNMSTVVQNEIKNMIPYLASIAKSTSETASNTDNIYQDGIQVEVV